MASQQQQQNNESPVSAEEKDGDPVSAEEKDAEPVHSRTGDFFAFLGHTFLKIVRLSTFFMVAPFVSFFKMMSFMKKGSSPLNRLGDTIALHAVAKQYYFTFPSAWLLFLTLFGLLGIMEGFVIHYIVVRETASVISSLQQSPGFLYGFLSMNLFYPLMVVFIITCRSGTAIAVETGLMKIQGQIDGLITLPVNIGRFIYFPRIVGISLAVLSAIIFCNAICYLSVACYHACSRTGYFRAVSENIPERPCEFFQWCRSCFSSFKGAWCRGHNSGYECSRRAKS